jgi:hypothetical protein
MNTTEPLTADQWICVDDRLPEAGQWCLLVIAEPEGGVNCTDRRVVAKFMGVSTTEYHWSYMHMYQNHAGHRTVSHWMPLPELPK